MLLGLVLTACTLQQPDLTREQAGVDYDILLTLPEQPIAYTETVKPVLERRCVVCHGCYDAPCQLKLSSREGIERGASKVKVYDGTRISGIPPTRLMIDANGTDEWRERGFYSVLADAADTPQQHLQDSVLYQLLRLKQRQPQARVGMLAGDFDLALNRKQSCPRLDEFEDYAASHPLWGMPYAMPNLEDDEYRVLVQWLAQGAPMQQAPAPSAQALTQIEQWEQFFNTRGNKQVLVNRYLYEHLFQAHLHFAGTPPREFYRLVRSTTPPGENIVEIPTIRPYESPGEGHFYYRLRPYHASIVAKDHVVYELSDARMARFRELFLAPDYSVSELPSHDPATAANPFLVFRDIPPTARYRFMLDDARFFIEGFIKGPVCRGQVALNVVEDHFWVFFFDPDHRFITTDPDFLNHLSDDLEMPTARGDTLRLFAAWTHYWHKLADYMDAKQDYFSRLPKQELDQALDFIWDGDGHNRAAALTVFRHFDSASVSPGLLGDYPETAWVIDYPLLERIHYLLVAGFNVYGNVGHQLNTRLYMDFLRMEGEDHFLAFLPVSVRREIRDSWYVGIRAGLRQKLDAPSRWLQTEVVTGYRSDDPQAELYRHIERRLAAVTDPDPVNRCAQQPCQPDNDNAMRHRADRAMARVAAIRGKILVVFPDLTFVRVRNDATGSDDALAYTLIRNKAYKNISSMFSDESRRDTGDLRDIEQDTLSVVPGLQGSYPNFFFDIDIHEVDRFAERYAAIRNRKDYERFVGLYGVRRTNTGFWTLADWFQQRYAQQEPVLSGLFDLNRYRNR